VIGAWRDAASAPTVAVLDARSEPLPALDRQGRSDPHGWHLPAGRSARRDTPGRAQAI